MIFVMIGIRTPSKEVRLEDREAIVSSMSFHYGVLLVKAELDQILCGLSETQHSSVSSKQCSQYEVTFRV